jgi:hypothetical protein
MNPAVPPWAIRKATVANAAIDSAAPLTIALRGSMALSEV